MADRKISYVNKDFTDFREALVDFTKQYYPELTDSLNDASVGSWLIDMVAGVSDSLSYHIDRAFQETNINTAQQTSSLYNLARNNGVKIPGPKGAIAEFQLTCIIPVNGTVENSTSGRRSPNWASAPIVKRGSKFTNGNVTFELDHNVDFSKDFDIDGVPNRTYEPVKDSNDIITGFKVSKFFVLSAGVTNTYTMRVKKKDAVPFKEIILPYNDIMSVESIIVKEGTYHQVEPTFEEFMQEIEYIPANDRGRVDTYRFFEVDSLIQPYRWGKKLTPENEPVVSTYGYLTEDGKVIPTASIVHGEWKPLRQKFMTEYTDKGYLKITFGAGHKYVESEYSLGDAAAFSKHLITRMVNNEALGVTLKPGSTMYILYRMGAGANSNLPKGSVNRIEFLDIGYHDCAFGDFQTNETAKIRASFTVTNTTPAISGRDMLSGEELRNYIKYNKGAQDRCVTLNDYRSRILQLPSAYGSPYRVGVTEENNKIMVYLLGLDYNGKLTTQIPAAFANNLKSYLSEYRMINDLVEMKAGKIINVSFEIDCYVSKSYDSADIATKIINTVKEYMDIDKHQMGDEIFLGDLEKEITLIDGVKNIIDLRVYNEFSGPKYSTTQTSQEVYSKTNCYGSTGDISNSRSQIDLSASDRILRSDNDTMIEIKYPEQDIRVQLKVR